MASATELKKNSYFIHNGEPVRVIRKEIVAYGTHSHSKLKLFVKGLTERGERSVTLHHTDKVDMLDIIRKRGQVLSVQDEALQVMDTVSYETFDAHAEDELLQSLNANDEVTFIDVNGHVQVIEKRQDA